MDTIRITLPVQEPPFSLGEEGAYQHQIKRLAKAQWTHPILTDRVKLYVLFYVMPDGDSRNLAAYLKPVLRALRRVVYLHETQVDQVCTTKVICTPNEKPKLEILIESI